MGVPLPPQSGFLSILYSIGSKPLQLWDKQVANGHVTRLTDEDIQSSVLELVSANVATTYITCPADKAATLGVKLPYLVMVVRTPPPVPAFPCHKHQTQGRGHTVQGFTGCFTKLA